MVCTNGRDDLELKNITSTRIRRGKKTKNIIICIIIIISSYVHILVAIVE